MTSSLSRISLVFFFFFGDRFASVSWKKVLVSYTLYKDLYGLYSVSSWKCTQILVHVNWTTCKLWNLNLLKFVLHLCLPVLWPLTSAYLCFDLCLDLCLPDLWPLPTCTLTFDLCLPVLCLRWRTCRAERAASAAAVSSVLTLSDLPLNLINTICGDSW